MTQQRSMSERFIIRMPDGLRERIKSIAEQNRRSMNSEILVILERGLSPDVADGDQLGTDPVR